MFSSKAVGSFAVGSTKLHRVASLITIRSFSVRFLFVVVVSGAVQSVFLDICVIVTLLFHFFLQSSILADLLD